MQRKFGVTRHEAQMGVWAICVSTAVLISGMFPETIYPEVWPLQAESSNTEKGAAVVIKKTPSATHVPKQFELATKCVPEKSPVPFTRVGSVPAINEPWCPSICIPEASKLIVCPVELPLLSVWKLVIVKFL